jgi:hypothetical protein
VETARRIQENFERHEAFKRMLDRPGFDAAGLGLVLKAREGMEAEFERLQVLLSRLTEWLL